MLKIGIVGYGFVGQAIKDGFNKSTTFFIVDPKKNTTIEDLVPFDPDVVFVCVPTPMNEDGSQNSSILMKVFKEIDEKLSKTGLLVLKSTVTPDNLKNIRNTFPKLIYNPEFLRENFAKKDFINSNMVILGGPQKEAKKLKRFYVKHSACKTKEYIITDLITASFIKYTLNTFLATKVVFFNQLFSLYKKSLCEEDWSNFIKYLSIDERIGTSHMQVPGPDGRYGYGGACFPKDMSAFYNFSKTIGDEFTLLSIAMNINSDLRASYEKLNREKEQNISFKKK